MSEDRGGLRIGFVSGLDDKKLAQKLAPLQAMPEVAQIALYRRAPLFGDKLRWVELPEICRRSALVGDPWRLGALIAGAARCDLLVGCHQRFHGVYAAIAGRLARRPVIQLVITDLQWIEASPLGAWSLRAAAAVGFRGQTSLARFRARYGAQRPLFVPHNVWQPPAGAPADTDKTIDLLYVGNFQAYKNIDGWLRVAAEVKRRRGALRAVLVGQRPDLAIERRARQLGLWQDLAFPGPLAGDDLDAHYAAARVLLLTSRWEGLPMVAAEALALGVPVVAPDVGDVRDLVREGTTGFVTRVGDTRGAARAVSRLLDDEALRQRLAHEGRIVARALAAQSTLEAVTDRWRAVLAALGLIERGASIAEPGR